MVDRRHLKAAPEELLASADECAALAKRFGLVKIRRLGAKLTLVADGEAVAPDKGCARRFAVKLDGGAVWLQLN